MEANDEPDTNEGNAEQTDVSHQNTPPFSHGDRNNYCNQESLTMCCFTLNYFQLDHQLLDEQVDKDCEPKWLEDFLNKSFFDSCTAHPLHRNELSIYCVNCNLSVCHYCASSDSHHQHKMLKLYRHNYKDVVSVASMKKHINCSQIQLFKNKKHSVIALKPLPHRGSANKNDASSCDICSRRLSEPDLYCYCSISCKVEAVSRKPNDSVPPFISIQSLPQEQKEETTEPPKRRNKKKGTPRRAPLF